MKPNALFKEAVSSLQRNSSLPSAAQSLNGGAAPKVPESSTAAGRAEWPAEDRLRAECQNRLAALGCFLGVEDPFDETDNAARTLRHFDTLLAHALLPVVYGTDALACCLREPVCGTGPTDQSTQDNVRSACNVMQKYEHPIQQDSDEQSKIDSLADRISRPGAWVDLSAPSDVHANTSVEQQQTR